MSFEANVVSYSFQGQATDNPFGQSDLTDKMSRDEALRKYVRFIREWRDSNNVHIYR